MTSSASSSVDLRGRLAGAPPGLPAPMLVVDGGRRDALWAWCDTAGGVHGGRIGDRGAAELLAPRVAEAAAALGHRVADTAAIVAGVGPGSYAGLRIALAFAKGMAAALGCPIIAVGSLEAMLDDVPRTPGAAHVAVLNAFAGQAFARGDDAAGQAWIASDVYAPEALSTRWREAEELVLLSDGPLPALAGLVPPPRAVVRDLKGEGLVLPLGLALAGLTRYRSRTFADARTLVPEYGQASSAELRRGS